MAARFCATTVDTVAHGIAHRPPFIQQQTGRPLRLRTAAERPVSPHQETLQPAPCWARTSSKTTCSGAATNSSQATMSTRPPRALGEGANTAADRLTATHFRNLRRVNPFGHLNSVRHQPRRCLFRVMTVLSAAANFQ